MCPLCIVILVPEPSSIGKYLQKNKTAALHFCAGLSIFVQCLILLLALKGLSQLPSSCYFHRAAHQNASTISLFFLFQSGVLVSTVISYAPENQVARNHCLRNYSFLLVPSTHELSAHLILVHRFYHSRIDTYPAQLQVCFTPFYLLLATAPLPPFLHRTVSLLLNSVFEALTNYFLCNTNSSFKTNDTAALTKPNRCLSKFPQIIPPHTLAY